MYSELLLPSRFQSLSSLEARLKRLEAATRDLSTSNNKVLFRINLIGGHGGLSGKTAVLKETSEDFTFFISLVDS